MTIKTRL